MKVIKKVRAQGEFAKVNVDFKDGALLTVLDGGTVVNGEYGDQHVFKLLMPNESEKNLTFNQTSLNNVISAYGSETDHWIGKKVMANVVKQNIAGSLKNVVYLVGEGWTMADDGKIIPPAGFEYPQEDINADDITFEQ